MANAVLHCPDQVAVARTKARIPGQRSGRQTAMSDNLRTAAYPVNTQLALIRRDLEQIHRTLYGNGYDRRWVERVEELAEFADLGQWSLKVALWLGGGIVAAATALAQFKQAILGLFHE